MNLVRYGSWIGGSGLGYYRGSGGMFKYGYSSLGHHLALWTGRSYRIPGLIGLHDHIAFYQMELHITWQERLYMLAMEVRRVPA